MFKMLIGNVLFFGILFCWYLYTDGDRSLLLAGTVMGFGCFISGIFMGYILHVPPKRRSAAMNPALVPVFAGTEESDQADGEEQATDAAADETEPEPGASVETDALVISEEVDLLPGDDRETPAPMTEENRVTPIEGPVEKAEAERLEIGELVASPVATAEHQPPV